VPPISGGRGAAVSGVDDSPVTPQLHAQRSVSSSSRSPRSPSSLRLRVGELVEVKSQAEILATLDRSGALDGLVFMPEMLGFCGRRFQVVKRADKTCDTVKDSGLRRMHDTVHLEGTRCDGSAHAGCQASCQIFWKEAWLRRVSSPAQPGDQRPGEQGGCTEEDLRAATQRASEGEPGDVIYRCQNTDVREASTPLPGWHLMQYVRDVRSGNAGVGEILLSLLWTAGRYGRSSLPGYRIQIWLYKLMQRVTGAPPLLDLGGTLKRTPNETLGLVPGELVQVKRVAEIRETLNSNQRNRGLYFDMEMAPYCGRTFLVRSRVTRIVNEKTGRLITIPGDCVILEGATCTGCYHRRCPRAIYGYWREIWLRRVSGSGAL
jgi:hypothetical protein